MNADHHSQVSDIAYGLHRGMTGTLHETHKNGESFPFPIFSPTSCNPLQSYHEFGGPQCPGRPYGLCAKTLLGLRPTPTVECTGGSRRKRELTPVEQKDSSYWIKRRRNNEAARRSRQRRRTEEILLETRAIELHRENEKLKATLSAVQCRFIPAGDHREIPSNRSITQNRFHYPTTTKPLTHNYDISKDLFSDRFAYFANHLPPPQADSYHTFSLNAASYVPTVNSAANVEPFATPAILQKNDCYRNVATRKADTGRHFTNYAPGTPNFQQGGTLFRDMEMDYSQNQESASSNHFALCKDGARSPRRPRESTPNNYIIQQDLNSQRGCYTVGSNAWGNSVADKLSTQKTHESGVRLPFLPHKLRFKTTSNKVRIEQGLSPNSARGKDFAVAEIPSMSDTKATCPTDFGEVAQNTTIFFNPRQTHVQETVQHKAAVSFSSPWEGSEHRVSAREDARTCAPQNSGACVFSLFRQSPNDDTENYAELFQGMQSAFHLEHEREMYENGLKNQLASLGAEVKHLKQILLAKSTA